MKKLSVLILALAILFIAGTKAADAKTKTYYSGDAIYYNDTLYVGSTNSDSLEVFKVENGKMNRILKFKPFNTKTAQYGKFSDVKFNEEDGKLYAYTASEFSFYKYDITSGTETLVNKVTNNYWEWYQRIDKFADNIVTISDKGVKIWDKNLVVIDSLKFKAKNYQYNVRSYNNRFVLTADDKGIYIFDRETRKVIKSMALNYYQDGNHKVYQDPETYNIYAADDYFVKKYDLVGNLLSTFKHSGYQAYDVSGSRDFLYFSNGIGIVKLNKDLKMLSSQKTSEWEGASWAMGLNVLSTVDGDKIVVFNNSNILVLNSNLNKIASFRGDEADVSITREKLYLKLDKNRAAVNSQVYMDAGGFLANEKVLVDFMGKRFMAQTNEQGKITKIMTVPQTSNTLGDVKLTGQESKLTYSVNFEVEK
ncbi:MAG: hypothetical protein MUF50_02125 [Planctomycetes bacterium]|jgi:hypothetical protein|nr:hypothetical protein [Planctomycetota bacterium]